MAVLTYSPTYSSSDSLFLVILSHIWEVLKGFSLVNVSWELYVYRIGSPILPTFSPPPLCYVGRLVRLSSPLHSLTYLYDYNLSSGTLCLLPVRTVLLPSSPWSVGKFWVIVRYAISGTLPPIVSPISPSTTIRTHHGRLSLPPWGMSETIFACVINVVSV